MKFELRKDLAYRRIAGELFVVDAAGSRLHELNGTAALIWDCLAAGKGRDGAAARLAAEFEVDAGTAGADVDAFIEELLKAGLLSGREQ